MLWDDSATRTSNHSEKGFSCALPLHGSSLQHFAFTLLGLMFHISFIKEQCLLKAFPFVVFTIISLGFWDISGTRVYAICMTVTNEKSQTMKDNIFDYGTLSNSLGGSF